MLSGFSNANIKDFRGLKNKSSIPDNNIVYIYTSVNFKFHMKFVQTQFM